MLTTFYTDKWFNRLTSHLHDQVNWVFKKEMLNPLSMYKQCLIGSEKHKLWKNISKYINLGHSTQLLSRYAIYTYTTLFLRISVQEKESWGEEKYIRNNAGAMRSSPSSLAWKLHWICCCCWFLNCALTHGNSAFLLSDFFHWNSKDLVISNKQSANRPTGLVLLSFLLGILQDISFRVEIYAY